MTKATKLILTQVDRSTKALDTAGKSLQKVGQDLAGTVTTLTGEVIRVSTDLEFKSSELANLEEEFKNKQRNAEIELDFKVRENESKTVEEILRKNKQVPILLTELEQLRVNAFKVQADIDTQIEEARSHAIATLEVTHKATLEVIKSNHAVETANINADIKALRNQVELLTGQLEDARQTVKEEREARIKIAESQSKASGVVVNTSK